MPKGIYSQGFVVLFKTVPKLSELDVLLSDFKILGTPEAAKSIELSGPALMLEYRPEVKGIVLVDLYDRVWPDHMGDPQKEANIFMSWVMGAYAPFAYPGNLARAKAQCWGWPEAGALVDSHRACVRIRSSYALGGKDAKCLPQDYDPIDELEFVSRVALALLRHPGAIALFNPGGEVLRSGELLKKQLEFAEEHQLPALDVWTNVRLFRLNDEWQLMDCVGNGQFDLPDVEVAFRNADPGGFDPWIRNWTLYLLKNGEVFKEGHTADGPDGTTFRVSLHDNGLSDPPRSTVRFLPVSETNLPPELLPKEEEEEKSEPKQEKPPSAARRPWWKIW